jgi:hypothetical protein
MAQSWMDLTSAPRMVRRLRLHGSGFLASATRLELGRMGLMRESHYDLPELLPPLVIVCSDREADPGLAGAALLAAESLSPVLLACLAVPLIRIGPLVEPENATPSRILSARANAVAARTTNGPSARNAPSARTSKAYPQSGGPEETSSGTAVAEPDLKTSLCVRVGALLIAGQALSFLQGARNQCVVDTMIEVNPLSIESKAYQVLKLRH